MARYYANPTVSSYFQAYRGFSCVFFLLFFLLSPRQAMIHKSHTSSGQHIVFTLIFGWYIPSSSPRAFLPTWKSCTTFVGIPISVIWPSFFVDDFLLPNRPFNPWSVVIVSVVCMLLVYAFSLCSSAVHFVHRNCSECTLTFSAAQMKFMRALWILIFFY